MKYSHLLCVLLAVALVILSIKITFMDSTSASDKKSQEEAVMDNILTRTSIRQFTEEQLSEKQVETLLRAGMAAPSAGNKQPWRFVVVQDKATQEHFASNIGPAGPAAKAPTLIVVCGDLTQTFDGEGLDYWVEDCSAVMENMLLAAHSMKLGGVWLGVYPIKKRCDAVKKALALPDSIMPLGMFAVGHPAEDPAPKDKWKPEYIHYGTWNDQPAKVEAAEKQWQKVAVSDARLDAFSFFKTPAALTVGKQGEMNSMTIGWGQIGTVWGKDVATVYVRQSRFTKHLMDKYDTFTIEIFPEDHAKVLEYLGSKSGRDEDKIKGSGLTLKTMESGAPAFEEGSVIIECRKIATTNVTLQCMNQELIDKAYSKEQDKGNFHTAYTGEITAVWVKK